MGKSRAEIRIDEADTIRIDFKIVESLLSEYAVQANTLLNVCLEENKLNLESDIIRVDYTCRIFSRVFGGILEIKNEPNKSKFNCIDGYNTYNILEYVSLQKFFLNLEFSNKNKCPKEDNGTLIKINKNRPKLKYILEKV